MAKNKYPKVWDYGSSRYDSDRPIDVVGQWGEKGGDPDYGIGGNGRAEKKESPANKLLEALKNQKKKKRKVEVAPETKRTKKSSKPPKKEYTSPFVKELSKKVDKGMASLPKGEKAESPVNRSYIKALLPQLQGQKVSLSKDQSYDPNQQELKRQTVKTSDTQQISRGQVSKDVKNIARDYNLNAIIAGATPLLMGLLSGDMASGVDVAAKGLLDVHDQATKDQTAAIKSYGGRLKEMSKVKKDREQTLEYYQSATGANTARTGIPPFQTHPTPVSYTHLTLPTIYSV